MPAVAKNKPAPKAKPAVFVTEKCPRCAKRIDIGQMVEPLPVPGGKMVWYRWCHQGCSWEAPYNSFDSNGNPAVDSTIVNKSTASGIENSKAVPPVEDFHNDINPEGESGKGNDQGLDKAFNEAMNKAKYDLQKADKGDDEYWEGQGPAGGKDKAEPKDAKGKAKAKASPGKGGGVQIPQHSPELEDWVRRVVREELGEAIPKVMEPLVKAIGGKLDEMHRTIAKEADINNNWRKAAEKRFADSLEEMLKKASEIQVVNHTYEINNKTTGQKVMFDKAEVLHECFPKVLDLATCDPRQHIFVAGPSGCGKTHMAGQLAKALGVEFGYMSCSGGINEAHLLGRTIPNVQTGKAVFVESEYVKKYENGGVFLLDEIDAADPNVLIVLNASLANGVLALPNRMDKPYATKHKDFICIVAANTFGRGSSRMYVGRNQLDEASLDRFRIGTVSMEYSAAIEQRLCPDKELYKTMLGWRNKIEAAGMRRVLSTRFMDQAHRMQTQKNWTIDQIHTALTAGWTKDEIAKVPA